MGNPKQNYFIFGQRIKGQEEVADGISYRSGFLTIELAILLTLHFIFRYFFSSAKLQFLCSLFHYVPDATAVSLRHIFPEKNTAEVDEVSILKRALDSFPLRYRTGNTEKNERAERTTGREKEKTR